MDNFKPVKGKIKIGLGHPSAWVILTTRYTGNYVEVFILIFGQNIEIY